VASVGLIEQTTRGSRALGGRCNLAIFYGTAIRASEGCRLREGQVDLRGFTFTVRGKGGHERTIPSSDEVARRICEYIQVRGAQLPAALFLRSRAGRALSRGTLYEGVRTLAADCRFSVRARVVPRPS
jgi:site-specific recombinase XerD